MAVLITRPLKESLELQKYLKGIKSYIFPTLTTEKLNTKLLHKNYQVIVFISKNSVGCGIEYIKELNKPLILAVGEKTAKTLENYGYKVDFYPKQNPSSKSLLAIPEVGNIKDKNILIIRGKGGVETLKNGFIKNNNSVDYLEVYERKTITNREEFIANLDKFLLEKQQLILITSCDILDALISLVDINKNINLLVVSERIKNYATSLGFYNIIVSKDISNPSIKKEIKEWLN